jgi:arsenite methyltransferase
MSLLPVMLREIFGEREFPREPEPDLVMNDPEQVKAYSEAGRADGLMAAAYLFHTAQISVTISGCREVVDLGCGPATQLAQVAGLHPEASFLGVDLSPKMLGDAESHVRSLGLDNVRFELGDITRLDLPDRSADAVLSTLVLHHLPSYDHLLACFREVARVLRPGGALYLADFGRLKSLKSVLFFAYMNAKHQPHVFSLDYERSLRAAFELEDFRRTARAALPRQATVFSTFKVPLLVLTKTGPRSLDPARRAEIRAMRSRLPTRYRRGLDELRFFFRLGGLDVDPFHD